MSRQKKTKTVTEADKLARSKRIMTLRKAGATYQAIGEALDPPITAVRVGQIIHEELAKIQEITSAETAEMRTLELERIDTVQKAIWTKVQAGHLGAVDRFLRLSNARAKLTGIYAPNKIAPTDPSGERPYGDPDELREILRQRFHDLGVAAPDEQGDREAAVRAAVQHNNPN